MSNLEFSIDIDVITKELQDTSKELAKDLLEGVEGLANMTHLRVLELAGDKLGSLAEKYKDNVDFTNPTKGLWIVTLKEPGVWIDDGRESGFMRSLLEGKSARTSKTGEKYAVVPFDYSSKPPTQMSSKTKELVEQIKSEFKKQKPKIDWQKIEVDANGSPRTGLIHTFNFDSARPSKMAKLPALHGINVFQHKNSEGKVEKQIVAFRTITESHESEGLWNYPGYQGAKLFEETLTWAMDKWENEILPDILGKK